MTTALAPLQEEIRIPAPELRGAGFALGACTDLEVCLDGPAGTGKTFAILYKIHLLLLMHPGAKALVARKTNTALAGSAIATYKELLDPNEGVHFFGGSKERPAAFEYPNGSVMIVNGLDKRDKIKSWEFDLAYINEATECEEEDIDYVRSRLRHGKIGYHQLLMDCNPDAPEHWLNVRMNEGKTTRLLSRHEDNPRYFDLKTNDWTEAGREYIFVVLAGLTGVLLDRMLHGLWAAAHGTVYQGFWDRKRNIIARQPIPRSWPRYMAIDFGYTNPFCCLWAAIDPDGRIIVYRQLYMSRRLVEEHARQIAIESGWFHLLPKEHPQYRNRAAENADPLPRDLICDHDAEGRATLQTHLGLNTTAARKAISEGIQAVAARLRPAGDGRPRLQFVEGSLIEKDTALAKAKQPTCVEEEANVYIWDTKQGMKKGEQPVDAYNHGWDTVRYMVANFDLGLSGTVTHYKDIWR